MAMINYIIRSRRGDRPSRRGFEIIWRRQTLGVFPTRKAAERFARWHNTAVVCVQWCCAPLPSVL